MSTLEIVAYGAYLLIGVVVAKLHIHLNDMRESVDLADKNPSISFIQILTGTHGSVEFLLAVIWPILAFAMLVNWLQPPPTVRRERAIPGEPTKDYPQD